MIEIEEKKTANEDVITEEQQITEGINDLMNIPIEHIQKELKKRGYHPQIVDRMPQWYLVSMLRESVSNSMRMRPRMYYRSMGRNRSHSDNAQGPIFSEESIKEKPEQDIEEATIDAPPQETEEQFDPSAYKEETSNPFVKKSSMFGFQQAQQIPLKPWKMHYSHRFSIEYFVPEEILDNLPLHEQQQIAQSLSNSYRFSGNPTKISISEIIEKHVLPHLKTQQAPASLPEDSQIAYDVNPSSNVDYEFEEQRKNEI